MIINLAARFRWLIDIFAQAWLLGYMQCYDVNISLLVFTWPYNDPSSTIIAIIAVLLRVQNKPTAASLVLGFDHRATSCQLWRNFTGYPSATTLLSRLPFCWRKTANLCLSLDADDCVRRTPTRARCSEPTHVLAITHSLLLDLEYGTVCQPSCENQILHSDNFDKHSKRIYLVTDSCSAEWQCFSCAVYRLAYLLTYLQ